MNKLRNGYLVLAVGALAVTGAACGSSSKSNTTAKSSTNPSATSSGASTASTSGVTASTPISSPAVRSLLIQGEQTRNHNRFNQRQLNGFTDCLIKKLQSEGVKTLGDLQRHQSEAGSLGRQCASALKS